MTFERIHCSGIGFVIGSIAGTAVRNITFRDSVLWQSYKNIYLKFRKDPDWTGGLIEEILFENITVEAPQQWREYCVVRVKVRLLLLALTN